MADQDHAATQVGDETLEPVEAVEVEIVGRFVEQDDIESGDQQRRQSDSRRLPARQSGHRRRIRLYCFRIQTEIGQHGGQALVEVGRAGGEPVIQRSRVHVGGVIARRGVRIGQRGGCRLHCPGCLGAPRAARDVGGDGLAGDPFVLLRQPADERVGGRDADDSVQGCELAGQNSQQGALARPVGSHHSDHVARRHGEVEALEEGAVREPAGQALRDQGCGHGRFGAASALSVN